MRHAVLVCAGMVVALVGSAEGQAPASDDERLAQLVADGQALAKAGNYSVAIERWKEADRLRPRAEHACLIGLAYTRREAWPQAEIFLTTCRQRATADDPVPTWLDTVERELAAKLAQAPVAAVTLGADAPGATFKVSSFAPDERVDARTIHLALGQHTITATAEGRTPTSVTVDIDSREPRTITIELPPLATREPDGGRPPPTPPPAVVVHHGTLPWIVVGVGGALAIGGGVYHATVLRGRWQDLDDTTDRGFYDGAGDAAWRSARRTTILLYSAAAVTIGAGVALRALGVGERRQRVPSLSFAPAAGGGVLSVGWER